MLELCLGSCKFILDLDLGDDSIGTDLRRHGQLGHSHRLGFYQSSSRGCVFLLFMEMGGKRQQWIIVRCVLCKGKIVVKDNNLCTSVLTWNFHSKMTENLCKHKITSAIDLHVGCGILWSPLEVNNVQWRPFVARPVHAPQPGIPPQHLETRAKAQDHVCFLCSFARPIPVDGPGNGASLTKMNNSILKTEKR